MGAIWSEWSTDPGIILPLAGTALLYIRGARRKRGVSNAQVACFWSGWLFLTIALISPIHELGEQLFWAHMAQHEILMLLAAPLLVLSRPLVPMLWGLPMAWRRVLGQWSKRREIQSVWVFLTLPIAAWWIHAAALWLWHIPRFFEATLTSDWVHSAQHLSFLTSALLFWWALFYARGHASYGASFLYVFTTAVHTSILGALLTFAARPWYAAYAATAPRWGLSALEDQQIGGLIMWIPAGVVYLAAGLVLFALWLREGDVLARRREYA
ncbi:MAG: cytochrome c oxidase assembly protein [Bryobacterales bacterium]|nr:cytochrome c oxidase assembly protein [Bryobacterales bacterium]MBV9396360.1 cytochrome c oxidase assembly protein [Bryobacterales bacterium]